MPRQLSRRRLQPYLIVSLKLLGRLPDEHPPHAILVHHGIYLAIARPRKVRDEVLLARVGRIDNLVSLKVGHYLHRPTAQHRPIVINQTN